jgi:hypothetical protein
MPVYEPSAHFKSLKIGQLGTVTNKMTGQRWEGDFYIEVISLTETDPPKELITVASVRRLVTKTPGHIIEKDPRLQPQTPDRLDVRLDQPHERSAGMPASWFTPSDPPQFFTPPATVAEAVTA